MVEKNALKVIWGQTIHRTDEIFYKGACWRLKRVAPTSHNIVTSSFSFILLMDRTVKLWSSSCSSSKDLKCLNSFEDFSDYVLDVAWSPVVPSMFASVDAGGMLSLWDVTSDLQMPYVSVRPDPSVALNRLAWSTPIHGKESSQVRI
jgi:WD40 repeat protein